MNTPSILLIIVLIGRDRISNGVAAVIGGVYLVNRVPVAR